ncbi:hypothetical protein AMK68_05310 [candidate division KD3-62 bacterium DG_56]|uniref:Uncharacterized protein n=1 Tax=candidate division KD3-62 bacterium DG_56 TaxID=1704032 RepID=A0A0S7XI19_9BACT|nr:MAG: hypothetical protein AMK68_05310 [candidate division KD3-62 bacterium DG_56]
MVTPLRNRRPSLIALSAVILVLVVAGSLIWSCRNRRDTYARADNQPGATAGTLLVICTGNTRASLETCS